MKYQISHIVIALEYWIGDVLLILTECGKSGEEKETDTWVGLTFVGEAKMPINYQIKVSYIILLLGNNTNKWNSLPWTIQSDKEKMWCTVWWFDEAPCLDLLTFSRATTPDLVNITWGNVLKDLACKLYENTYQLLAIVTIVNLNL